MKFNMLLDYCIGKAAANMEEFYILPVGNKLIQYDTIAVNTIVKNNVEIDGAVGMNSGIFNNPFMIWGRYKRKIFKSTLTISFQFHHTQMDGAHAGRFLENLQKEIYNLKV